MIRNILITLLHKKQQRTGIFLDISRYTNFELFKILIL